MTQDNRPPLANHPWVVETYDGVPYVDGMTLYRLAGNVDCGFEIIELPETHLDPRGGEDARWACLLTSNERDSSQMWTMICNLFASRQAATQEVINQLTKSREHFARIIDRRNADIARWQQQ